MFHVEAPPWTPSSGVDGTATGRQECCTQHALTQRRMNALDLDLSPPDILSPVPSASRTPAEPIAPPPPTSLVEATGLVSLAEGRSSPSLLDGRSRKKRSSSSSSRQLLRRDTVSLPSERMSRLQQDKQMLMEEVKAQKVIDHTLISNSY